MMAASPILIAVLSGVLDADPNLAAPIRLDTDLRCCSLVAKKFAAADSLHVALP